MRWFDLGCYRARAMSPVPEAPDPGARRAPTLSVPMLSVVVPVRNEGPNILPLVAEIRRALGAVAHEIVYVDDGSSDDTGARLREAAVLAERRLGLAADEA